MSERETGSGREGLGGRATPARRALLSAATDLGDEAPAARPADASLVSGPPHPAPPAAAAPPEAAGRRRIGIYEVEDEIGRGGMGAVYRAWHPARRRHVALKVIHPHLAGGEKSERLREAFLREGGVLMAVAHESIVACHDVNETTLEGRPVLYMALELLEGETLAHRLERGALPPREALGVAKALGRALAALHGHTPRVLHRDLKPGNVFLTEGGATKLLDFGLAAIADWKLTQVSAFAAGSRPYMSPEQFDGLRRCTERSDLYSLGVTLFQALTGRCPFEADTDQGFYKAHREKSPPSLAEAHPGLEGGPLLDALESIVTKLLAKRPEERYASAADLIADLERSERGAAVLKPKVTRPETIRFRRRLARGTIALALLALAAVAGAVAIRGSASYRLRGGEEAFAGGDYQTAENVALAVLEVDPKDPQALELRAKVDAAKAELARRTRVKTAADEARAALQHGTLEEMNAAIGRALADANDDERRTVILPLEQDQAARKEREQAAADRLRAIEEQRAALARARAALDAGRRAEAATIVAELEREGPAADVAGPLADARRDVEEAEGVAGELEAAEGALRAGRPAEAAVLAARAASSLAGPRGAALERRVGEGAAARARELEAAAGREVALHSVRQAVATRDPETVRRALAEAGDRVRQDDPERAQANAILHEDAIARAERGLAEARFEDVELAAREALRALPPAEAAPFRTLARAFEADRHARGDPSARDALREGLRALPRAERAWLLLERAAAERVIPPGTKLVARYAGLLGSQDADSGNPEHQVELAPFYLDATEVTAGAFAERFPERRPEAGKERRPAVDVSFAEAKAYALARAERLPTADEWEAAASVDPRAKARRTYPWGEAWPHPAAPAVVQKPGPVGAQEDDLSPVGCVDMGGNVQEWTADPRDPAVPVLKGGASTLGEYDRRYFKAAARFPASVERADDIGFRCARDASVPDLREFAAP